MSPYGSTGCTEAVDHNARKRESWGRTYIVLSLEDNSRGNRLERRRLRNSDADVAYFLMPVINENIGFISLYLQRHTWCHGRLQFGRVLDVPFYYTRYFNIQIILQLVPCPLITTRFITYNAQR